MEIADAPLALPDSTSDFDAQIASLRTAGANRFDPVRFHYIEALAKRTTAHQGSARRMLNIRLANALAALKERFDLAHRNAQETVAQSAQQYPDKANDLQRLLAAGEFRELRRLAATLKTSEQRACLGALVRQLEQHSLENAGTHMERNAAPYATPYAASYVAPYAELKTIRNFRNTWAKLSVDRQVAQAFEQAPKNAGPINSHMLVLRLLALMRDISPDYLNRFISYADTLLALDQDEKEKPVESKKRRATRAIKK